MTTYHPFKIYALRAAATRLDELVSMLLPTVETYEGDCRHVPYEVSLVDGSMGWSYQGCDSTIWLISELTGVTELDRFERSREIVRQRRDFAITKLREHVSSICDQ